MRPGRLTGEGFDHPPLDTLVLAMPISWKGTLQQCAGRLHREHADKQGVRIYDYVDDRLFQFSARYPVFLQTRHPRPVTGNRGRKSFL